MEWRKLLLLVAILALAQLAQAQSTKYGVGRTPTPEEIRAWDISIGPDGKELPPGHGTAAEGAKLFREKQCVVCHGSTGSGGPAPTLIKSDGTKKSKYPCLVPCVDDALVMSLHAQYATTMWDYINRAMPLNKQGTLKPDEVYSLVAFLLFKNGVIAENQVLDPETLPRVKMPNRDHAALAPEWKHAAPRLQGYP
ncbi:MAG: cytochrome c [Acidobacteriia bacterium]|nr:cytochrome c [Terriglobia bacterium]